MPASAVPAPRAPLTADVLQLGWVELLGHALHYGLIGAGLLGVLALLLPGTLAPVRRRRSRAATPPPFPRADRSPEARP